MNMGEETLKSMKTLFEDEKTAEAFMQAGLIKASMEIVNLKDNKIPTDAKKCFLSIATSVTKLDQNLQKIYIIDNIALIGTVIRMFVIDKKKAEARIGKEYKNISNYGELRSYISGKETILSVYYDADSVLGFMDKPYIEMYNFIADTFRFYPNETKEIREKTVELIKQSKRVGRD